MSFAARQPEALAAAIARLASLAPALTAKNIAAAAPTAGMAPAAADDVSAIMAAQFAIQAQIYQAVSAQMCQALSAQAAAAIEELFVSTSTDSGHSDAAAEGTDAAAGV
jgi:PE family